VLAAVGRPVQSSIPPRRTPAPGSRGLCWESRVSDPGPATGCSGGRRARRLLRQGEGVRRGGVFQPNARRCVTLILSRKTGQDIVITSSNGEVIVVRLLDVQGHERARIGFTAPPGVRINRREVQERKPYESNDE
jgi:sRNA-binding carbon storage regulator CsrA